MARPRKRVDKELLLDLARIHCTMNELSTITHVSVDTLERRYADVIEKGREEGKRSLRRLQWEKAEAGNVVMMIWLGKQWLGQSDRAITSTDGAVTVSVRYADQLPPPPPDEPVLERPNGADHSNGNGALQH